MSTTQQPEALNLEEFRAKVTHAAREPLLARIAELEDSLQFVERWAVHHGSKPSISAEEALSCIQHYPAIHEITKSYEDGKRPDTFNPYARIAELEAQLEESTHTTKKGMGGNWLTVVYRDIQPGDEAQAIAGHPKASALSWSHALHDRDTAIAAQAKQGEQ